MFADFDRARDDISASSGGGAPFLIAFGVTLLATAVASVFVSRSTAALIVMFQGNLALPAAFWLERRMRARPMASDNPLKALSIQLAMSQIVAFPIVIAVYNMNPAVVPVAMASIAGGHFLPYAWLHRSNVYIYLGVAVSVGALAIQIVLGRDAFPWVVGYMSLCYAIAAPLVYRHAKRLTMALVPAESAATADARRMLSGPTGVRA